MNPNNAEIGNRIKGLLYIKGISRKELADIMELSYNSLTKKLNGKVEFGLKDMYRIKEAFNLDTEECVNIFFNEEFLIKKQTNWNA